MGEEGLLEAGSLNLSGEYTSNDSAGTGLSVGHRQSAGCRGRGGTSTTDCQSPGQSQAARL